jgi:anti-sigma factor RsiW
VRDHLGDRAAALVDGQLGHDARDRALAHLARCTQCQQEVELQRRLKAALGGTQSAPAPPQPLVEDLLRALPAPAAGTHRHQRRIPSFVAPMSDPAALAPPRVRPVPHRWRVQRIAAAAVLAVGVAVLGLAALGGGHATPTGPSGPSVDPASQVYVTAHLATSRQVVPEGPAATGG